jgi:uncharacterized protein YgiM (DUF1202 family)
VSAAPSRTGSKAIAWAKTQTSNPSRSWHNLCLMFTRKCFGVAAREPNAKRAWETAKRRHATTNAAAIPAGVPVFWRTGTVNWHIAISIGGGYCYSTDIPRGKVGRIGITDLSRRWGATLLGWTEDLNGVTIYTKPKTPVKPKTARYKVATRLLPLNGRSGPGTSYRKIATAKRGTVLSIVETKAGWAKDTGGRWWRMAYLKKA